MKVWTIDKKTGGLTKEELRMTAKWLIVDEHTGMILGQCDGGKETARDLFSMMEESLPDDGDSWTIYERVGV